MDWFDAQKLCTGVETKFSLCVVLNACKCDYDYAIGKSISILVSSQVAPTSVWDYAFCAISSFIFKPNRKYDIIF